MSAFKRLQDISFPAWPRKCVYRWLIGAEVRLRTLHRDAVETFHARRSLPSGGPAASSYSRARIRFLPSPTFA